MDDKDNGAGRTADQRVAAVHLQRRLQAIVDDTVELRLNHNTSTLLTVRKPRGPRIPWRFNLHVMFLHADDEVLRALPAYARGEPGATAVLRRFIDANMHHVTRHTRASRLNLRPRGKCHDLHELARGVNDEFFGGNLSVYITWGQERRAPARSGRSRAQTSPQTPRSTRAASSLRRGTRPLACSASAAVAPRANRSSLRSTSCGAAA